ncbi:MAG: transposase [Burkholderiales bacterium]|nr:transposase [Phycisphaerae bacterium]
MQLGLFGQPVVERTKRNKQNLLLDVAVLALHVGSLTLDSYSRPKSPHLYTQPQLLAILILKAYLKQTYRGIIEVLETSKQLCDALGLKDGRLPDHSSLKKFADRLGPTVLDQAVAQLLAFCLRNESNAAAEVAMDSTGVECSTASQHYQMRIGRGRGRYVKLSLAVTCTTLLLVTFAVSFGPSHDRREVMDVLWRASGRCTPGALYADAGYDLEAAHAFCRDGWGVRSYIPPVARGGFGTIASPHRATMAGRDLTASGYGRRWHIESFISGFKRTTSPGVRARTDAAMLTEAALNLLAYAIRRM